MAYLSIGFAALFAGCLIWAAVSDAIRLEIPNEIPLCLCAGFILFSLFSPHPIAIHSHVLAASAVFLGTFGLFALRFMGGGDAKLIPAIALWTGPQQTISFLVWMALAGGIFGGILLVLKWITLRKTGDRFAQSRLLRLAHRGLIPYAVPIASSAFLNFPAIVFAVK